jgi:hypothetical protein
VVRAVPSEEHELVRGSARERHDVIRRVPGRLEEVERAIVKPIDSTQPGNFPGPFLLY